MGTCQKCGKPTQEEWHKFCPECFYKQRGRGEPRHKKVRLDDKYLQGGYFRDDAGHQRPEIYDQEAELAALALGNAQPRLTSNQLRRFFNKMRAIEGKLDAEGDFLAVQGDLYAFKRDVVYAVGRKVVPEEFKTFIDRNVDLAVKDESSFRRGFIQHFQSVVAWFVYHFRNR